MIWPIVESALRNFIPLACFLIAYFIIMATYEMLFVYIVILLTQMVLVLAMDLRYNYQTLNFYSMNRFLVTNTFIIALLYTIKLHAIGTERNDNLLVRPFDGCDNTLLSDVPQYFNIVFSHSTQFLVTIWIMVFLGLVHTILECIYPPKEHI